MQNKNILRYLRQCDQKRLVEYRLYHQMDKAIEEIYYVKWPARAIDTVWVYRPFLV